MDDNEVPATGWALGGKRCYAEKSAERNTRYNIIASLMVGTIVAPFVFEGYVNRAVYETYVEKVLVPVLRPGMVVVLDNASFHKSKKIINLIDAAGCRVLFLPPYSPDLNPIEHYWSSIKHSIRKSFLHTEKDCYTSIIDTLAEICTA